MSDRQPRVLITGASRGIGKATMERLASRGYEVIGAARSEVPLNALCKQLVGAGYQASYRILDLSQPASIDGLIAELGAEPGGIDHLVLNAGQSYGKNTWDLTETERAYEFQINYHGPLRLLQGLLPQMVDQRHFSVTVVSSVAARVPFPGNGNYAASKAAFLHLLRSLKLEEPRLAPHLRLVLPGLTDTAMSKSFQAPWLPASSPEAIADAIHNGIRFRLGLSVPGIHNKALLALDRLSPSITDRLVGMFSATGSGSAPKQGAGSPLLSKLRGFSMAGSGS